VVPFDETCGVTTAPSDDELEAAPSGTEPEAEATIVIYTWDFVVTDGPDGDDLTGLCLRPLQLALAA
jgi:hypothetical protein